MEEAEWELDSEIIERSTIPDDMKLIELIYDSNDKIDWKYLATYDKVPDSFITDLQYQFDWEYLLEFQPAIIHFIRAHKDKMDWNWIFKNQVLPDSFINEFKID